jgi:tRNA(Ile)-lysidine synthase
VKTAAGELLARCTFPPAGTALVCAVSGGADSLALLALAVEAGCAATAVHVDHGLRDGSANEADVVAAAAARLGAGFRAERVSVPPGPNLEERAREARFSVLPADVATGHTADDQAETVLINLLRGAALDGLAGMRKGTRHPILGIRRSETRELCAALGLEAVRDPSNLDPGHLRNRVRHELLPLLEQLSGRDVVAVVARQAELLADDSDLLEELSAELDEADSRQIGDAPLPLARRAVRRLVRDAQPDRPHPPSAAAVERVLRVARREDRACEIGGGARVRRSGGRLSVEAEPRVRLSGSRR